MATTQIDGTRQVKFSGVLDLQTHKIVNVTDPTGPQDVATKAYVDAISQGLDIKASVKAATTVTGTLGTAYANGQTIDGYTLVTGDRILIKNQGTGSENGIYTVNASGTPTRATDADTSAKVTPGLFVFVEQGTVNQDSGWVLTTDPPITLGTTALVFAQFSGAGNIVAGAGLTKSGNTLDVVAADASITVAADSIGVKPSTTPGDVYIGNAGNVATPTTLTGDVTTVTGAGVVTLATGIQRVSGHIDRATPTGAVNGSNTVFTLAFTPTAGSEHVYLNGILQEPAGEDYTISGSTITYVTAPLTGDRLRVSYRK